MIRRKTFKKYFFVFIRLSPNEVSMVEVQLFAVNATSGFVVDHQYSFYLGRHLLALTNVNDGMQFFREHALKSVWKPIVAFRTDAKNDALDYKTVNIHWFFD